MGWHVTAKVAHRKLLSSHSARAGYCCSIAALLIFFGCHKLQSANAEGDTRTISFHHVHTDEELTVTYKNCIVKWQTHSAGNALTLNDFICAAKDNALYAQRCGA